MKDKHGPIMTVLMIGIVIIALVLAFNAKTTTIISEAGDDRNTISVTGTASLEVSPDKAEVYVKVETEEKTALAAKNRNSRKANDVIAALKAIGIDKDEIETSRFSIYPNREWDETRRTSEITSYIATHVLRVTTNDVEDVGKLIDKAVNAGANGLDRIELGLTKSTQEEVNAEVLKRASEQGKNKAESLAKTMKVKLGDIVSISESNFNYRPYQYYPRAAGMAEMAVEESISIQPEDVEVSAYVSLVFEIE